MDMVSGEATLLFRLALDGKGGATAQPCEVGEGALWEHGSLNWEPQGEAEPRAAHTLESALLEPMRSKETRARFEALGDEALLILKVPNLNPGAEPGEVVSLRVWTDGKSVLTYERVPIKAVRRVQERLELGRGPKKAGDLLAALCLSATESISLMIAGLQSDANDLEDLIDEEAEGEEIRELIARLRRLGLHYRRHLGAMRLAIDELVAEGFPWLNHTNRLGFSEAGERIARMLDELEALGERLQIQREALMAATQDELNRNMYRLSVVAAIFLPLSFVTGLLGINVGGMPGAEDGFAFWWVTGGLMACGVALVVWLRKAGWF
ncbi:CorA family divalent cation transporter [Pseudokordiimonas caeni]|uniref:CorA family divalent cation transporter n=1 Tax=Pseudokordiimonas caeni TaxID=2997908 RepID=UPI002810A8E2|nr:CorA family divalent cation transporter [Pseudokordiimonas caeni]